ncbi:MAG: hypothetical protein OXE77_00095 [Flavobacteriaceae bacterium]|nr:hypothetical protein [Flavobacteriaceae bacterium]MCY4267006.1 hypothetical protein [Flavobacteriaceae bacterium]
MLKLKNYEIPPPTFCKIFILLFYFLTIIPASSQEVPTIFRGFYQGMDKKTALTEFRQKKQQYRNIVFSPTLVYRLVQERLSFDHQGKLFAISLRHQRGGSMAGQFWNDAVRTYKELRDIFGDLGYDVLREPEWFALLNNAMNLDWSNWKQSTNLEEKLLLVNEEKRQAIEFEFVKSASQTLSILVGDYNASPKFNVWIHAYTYDYAMDMYQQQETIDDLLKEQTGF